MKKPGIEPATLDFKPLFVAVFFGCTSTGRVGLWSLLFYVQEHPKAQLAVVLDLKCLRRRAKTFCGFPGYKSVLPGWFKICVGFITGTRKGSPKVVLWSSWESNFTRHRFIPYITAASFFVAFLGLNQFCQVGLRFVLVL